LLVFRYFLKELVPQFLSALIVICSIIVVSQLVRLSEVLVTFGLSLENVFLPFLYIILPFISLTIPMAFLFAVVLTFGRLSNDGEYAALLAAGYSLRRASRPVMLTAVVLYFIAAASALNLEAWGRRELVQFLYRKTQSELDNMVKYKMQSGVFLDDFLGYVIYAEKISSDRTKFENVMIAPGSDNKKDNFTMLAPSGSISGSVETEDLMLSLDYGVAYSVRPGTDKTSILKFTRAEIDLLRVFREQITGGEAAEDDFRSYRPFELVEFIDKLKTDPKRDEGVFRRASYLLHSRIGSPFAVITFAFFGMVLGVSDPRRGKSAAYIGAIGTIIAGYILMMAFKWLAEAGHLSPVAAAWLPNLLLFSFGLFLVYQKNRLPPSEGTLDPQNLPFLRQHGGAKKR
jgi:lipopolysaccharide export system permease protein